MDQTSRDDADDLDALPTEELRQRAFSRAERHADLAFFWDLIKHLPHTADAASEGGSAGEIGGTFTELIAIVRELRGFDADADPVIRIKCLDYLRTHGG